MTPRAVEGYECLASSETHALDYAALKSAYEPVQSERTVRSSDSIVIERKP